MERVAGTEELAVSGGVYETAESIQSATALLPDYGFSSSDSAAGTSISGLVGGVLVIGLCIGLCYALKFFRKGKNR